MPKIKEVLAELNAFVDKYTGAGEAETVEADVVSIFDAVVAEVKSVGVQDVETLLTTVATTVLAGLTGGESFAAIVGLVVTGATAELAKDGKQLSEGTLTTLASAVLTKIPSTVVPAIPAAPVSTNSAPTAGVAV